MYGKDYIEQRDVDELVALITAAIADAGAGFDADTVERAGTIVAERRLPLRRPASLVDLHHAAFMRQGALPGFDELVRQQRQAADAQQQPRGGLASLLGGAWAG